MVASDQSESGRTEVAIALFLIIGCLNLLINLLRR